MGWYDTGLASATQGQAQALAGLASLKPVDYLSGLGSIMSKYGAEQQAEADKAKQLAMQQQGLDIQQGTYENAMARQKAQDLENLQNSLVTMKALGTSKYGSQMLGKELNPEAVSALGRSIAGLSDAEKLDIAKQLPSVSALANLEKIASARDLKDIQMAGVQAQREATQANKNLQLQMMKDAQALKEKQIDQAYGLGVGKLISSTEDSITKELDKNPTYMKLVSSDPIKAELMKNDAIKLRLQKVLPPDAISRLYGGASTQSGDAGLKQIQGAVVKNPVEAQQPQLVPTYGSSNEGLISALSDMFSSLNKKANAPAINQFYK